DAIQRATLGNALFVDGVVRAAIEDGALEKGTIRVPTDVRRAIEGRVARASAEVAEALRVAAVIGRPFTIRLLAEAVGSSPAEIESLVARAIEAGLLSRHDDARYAFRHTLVADALTASIAASELARRHAVVAQAIESIEGSLAVPAELARHLAKA